MVLISEIVSIPWSHSLEINNIAPLVSASDSFDLDTSCNLNFLLCSIDNFVHLDVHFLSNLLHHLMELLIGLNCLLLIDSAVLS